MVRIGIININTQAERTVVDQQTWRYDPDKHQWWLTSGLPDVDQRALRHLAPARRRFDRRTRLAL